MKKECEIIKEVLKSFCLENVEDEFLQSKDNFDPWEQGELIIVA